MHSNFKKSCFLYQFIEHQSFNLKSGDVLIVDFRLIILDYTHNLPLKKREIVNQKHNLFYRGLQTDIFEKKIKVLNLKSTPKVHIDCKF